LLENLSLIECLLIAVLFIQIIEAFLAEHVNKTLSSIETMLRISLTMKPGTTLTDSELRSFVEQAEGVLPVQARFHIPRALFPEKPPIEPEYR
jgi:hypothetical protein